MIDEPLIFAVLCKKGLLCVHLRTLACEEAEQLQASALSGDEQRCDSVDVARTDLSSVLHQNLTDLHIVL